MFYRLMISLCLLASFSACGSSGEGPETNTLSAEKTKSLKTSALRDARATSKATLKGDWKTVIHHTHPNVVKAMGGPEAAADLIGSMMNDMSEMLSIDQSKVGDVSEIAYEQGEYRCLVENYLTVTVSGLITKKLSYLFGVYDPQKEIWYFIEANELKDKKSRELLLPGFKTALEIPDDKTL